MSWGGSWQPDEGEGRPCSLTHARPHYRPRTCRRQRRLSTQAAQKSVLRGQQCRSSKTLELLYCYVTLPRQSCANVRTAIKPSRALGMLAVTSVNQHNSLYFC